MAGPEAEFNWALDWFDAELAANADSRDRTALWIVDVASGSEIRKTFAELSARSNQVANFLRAQGLKRGDHLLLLLGNVVPLWETMLAAMKLGVIVIPATTLLTPGRIAGPARPRQGARCCGRHKISSRNSTGLKARTMSSEIAVGEGACRLVALCADGRRSRNGVHAPNGVTRADDPMLLYFTSGTTAKPKLVLHSHRSYPVGALTTMFWIGLKPGDIHLNISSPGWAKHAWSCFFAPWNAGATIFIANQARFEAKGLLDTLQRCQCDHAVRAADGVAAADPGKSRRVQTGACARSAVRVSHSTRK